LWKNETAALNIQENPLELQPSFKSPFITEKEEEYLPLDKSKVIPSPDIPLGSLSHHL
jgi:hypothetical protein